MSISFSGLASGLQTDDWVEKLVAIKKTSTVDKYTAKQEKLTTSKNAINTVNSTFTSLRNAIEKLTDAKFGSNFDLFSKNTVSSSNEDVVTATVTSTAARQNLNVVVEKLASYTIAKSSNGSDTFVSDDTKFTSLSSGNANAGSFNVFVEGEKFEIDVEDDESVGSVLDKISAATGLTTEIIDGKVKISDTSGRDFTVGSTTDSSNFASVLSLVKQSDGSTESFSAVSKINTSAALTSEDSGFTGVTTGSFKIGGEEFEITDSTTLKGLISDINKRSAANVTAYWDSTAGQMVLTSKVEGAFNIGVENISGNFTDVVGLTTSTYKEDGTTVDKSVLNEGTQTLGDYAVLSINGTKLVSSSNTVTSDISGIDGLTLNLNSVSSTNATSGIYNSTNVSVKQDTDTLLTAVKSFITEFNTTLEKVDELTASGSALYGETSLNSIRNGLRISATALDEGSSLKLLASVGIITGKAQNTTDTSTVNQLQLDENTFLEALNSDPTAVKELLLGGTNNTGVLTKLENIVESATSATGYLTMKSSSLSKEISNLDDSITKAEDRLTAYQTQLKNQFANMETMIAKMQEQYSSFLSSSTSS